MILQASSSRALNNAIIKSLKCTTQKPVLAILENILIVQMGEGHFFFISSDGDSQLTIPAPLSIINGKWNTPLAIPAKMITSFLQTLPDCTVNLNFEEGGYSLTIEYCLEENSKVKKGRASQCYIDGTDFPLLHGMQASEAQLSIPTDILLPALSRASDFIADDILRPIMSCACIDIAEDGSNIYIVSTDGRKLIKQIYSNSREKGYEFAGKPCNFLIQKKNLHILSVFKDCDIVTIVSDGKKIKYSSGDVEYICNNMEGKYPNYNSVIPKDIPYYITFTKKEFLDILQRVSLFGNINSKLIVFKKDGAFLHLTAQDIDFSRSAEDDVTIEGAECEDGFRIGFNWSSIRTAVNAIPSENIKLQLIDPMRAVVVTSGEPASNILTLAMPMMITD